MEIDARTVHHPILSCACGAGGAPAGAAGNSVRQLLVDRNRVNASPAILGPGLAARQRPTVLGPHCEGGQTRENQKHRERTGSAGDAVSVSAVVPAYKTRRASRRASKLRYPAAIVLVILIGNFNVLHNAARFLSRGRQ